MCELQQDCPISFLVTAAFSKSIIYKNPDRIFSANFRRTFYFEHKSLIFDTVMASPAYCASDLDVSYGSYEITLQS